VPIYVRIPALFCAKPRSDADPLSELALIFKGKLVLPERIELSRQRQKFLQINDLSNCLEATLYTKHVHLPTSHAR
jgi:hypothetical protein